MATRKRTKTTEITVERSDVFVVRWRKKTIYVWCPTCATDVGMCTPDEAAALAGVSPRTIYRWIEAGRIHFTETPGGPVLVCSNSVPERR